MHCNKFQPSDPSCRRSPRRDRCMHSPWSCNKVHIQRWRSFPVAPSTSGPCKSPGTSSAAAAGSGRAPGCRSWTPCGWANRSRMRRRWRKRRRRRSVASGCCGPPGSTACQARSNLHLMTVRGSRSDRGLDSDSSVAAGVADAGTDAEGAAGCWGHCHWAA